MSDFASGFRPAEATGIRCPDCGHALNFNRSCTQPLIVCAGCGASFDPIRFLDQLDDDFDEVYADVPMDRM